ncbi:hypothetical protein ACOME3_001661 [Neoechinorhynchus agilis]
MTNSDTVDGGNGQSSLSCLLPSFSSSLLSFNTEKCSSPISGLCIVSDYSRCPNGYNVIRNAYDDPTHPADLQRDSFFKRIDRYLCITRYPFDKIVEDVIILNQMETPPPSYASLTTTIDSHERSTSKKIICVKMNDRRNGMRALADIVFLCKQRKAPAGFSIVGEINGLTMCAKMATVEIEAPPKQEEPTKCVKSFFNTFRDDDDHETSAHNRFIFLIPFKLVSPNKNASNSANSSVDLLELKNMRREVQRFEFLKYHDIEKRFGYDFKTEKNWTMK